MREVRIGKNKINHLIIKDAAVDNHHAILLIENESVVLYDLNSRYGTYT